MPQHELQSVEENNVRNGEDKEFDLNIEKILEMLNPLGNPKDEIKNYVRKDIVLKSEGTQYYSYTYVADAVCGLLYVLLLGKKGEAYNIADESSDIMLRDLAKIIADSVGNKVVFEIPDAIESMGYSKATKARLDSTKLQELGWKSIYDIQSGIQRTIKILSEL
jgi:nucleoside-diphosphate-sugar epimerase